MILLLLLFLATALVALASILCHLCLETREWYDNLQNAKASKRSHQLYLQRKAADEAMRKHLRENGTVILNTAQIPVELALDDIQDGRRPGPPNPKSPKRNIYL